jgi:regulator of replication initiation timing
MDLLLQARKEIKNLADSVFVLQNRNQILQVENVNLKAQIKDLEAQPNTNSFHS